MVDGRVIQHNNLLLFEFLLRETITELNIAVRGLEMPRGSLHIEVTESRSRDHSGPKLL